MFGNTVPRSNLTSTTGPITCEIFPFTDDIISLFEFGRKYTRFYLNLRELKRRLFYALFTMSRTGKYEKTKLSNETDERIKKKSVKENTIGKGIFAPGMTKNSLLN